MEPHRSPVWIVAIFLVIGAVLVVALRQSAMFVGSDGPPHSVTRIVLSARYRDGKVADQFDVGRLWLACATFPERQETRPLGRGTLEGFVTPALGPDDQRRLVGCLTDLILPGLLGDVRSAQAVPLGSGSGPAVPSATRSSPTG